MEKFIGLWFNRLRVGDRSLFYSITFVVGTCDSWCARACWYWPLRHQYWIQETCPLTSEGKCQNAVKLSLKLQNIVDFQSGVGYRTKPCEKFLSKQNSRTESWICLIRCLSSWKVGRTNQVERSFSDFNIPSVFFTVIRSVTRRGSLIWVRFIEFLSQSTTCTESERG